MKPGLQVHDRTSMTVVVTQKMIAAFGGVPVHPVLSTVQMIYYMEWVGRQMILPYLEPREEGVGAEIQVRHLLPAPVGSSVTFIAEVIKVNSRQVTCCVRAEHNRGTIGDGIFVQSIVPIEMLEAKRLAMQEFHDPDEHDS
jgi:predicted thioesterase